MKHRVQEHRLTETQRLLSLGFKSELIILFFIYDAYYCHCGFTSCIFNDIHLTMHLISLYLRRMKYTKNLWPPILMIKLTYKCLYHIIYVSLAKHILCPLLSMHSWNCLQLFSHKLFVEELMHTYDQMNIIGATAIFFTHTHLDLRHTYCQVLLTITSKPLLQLNVDTLQIYELTEAVASILLTNYC